MLRTDGRTNGHLWSLYRADRSSLSTHARHKRSKVPKYDTTEHTRPQE
jgi:hypothetical protein